ncbi:MAG: type II secretion system protein GspM [Spongiibacteraceae bacterium]|jgi:general secretion pathway protein M
MQQWFNNLKRQEQLLLLVGAVVLVAYLLIIIVLRPMSASVASLEIQNKVAQESLYKVQALAETYKTLAQSGAVKVGAKQNLTRLIDTTVKKNQLLMNRFQPSSSGDVQVRFDNAVYNNILVWLHELESDHGVVVKDLSISTGSAPGLVSVSVRLRQGS